MISSPQRMESEDWKRIARLLFDLGTTIREGIRQDRKKSSNEDSAAIHRVTHADTIYEIDRVSERELVEWFRAHWPDDYPADVIAEGLGDEKGVRFPEGAPDKRLTILIDPIDGTRGLMYDKRSAWMLAGAAEGNSPTMADLKAGAMVELPTRRQQSADGVCAWETDEGHFHSEAVRGGDSNEKSQLFQLKASQATDLRHGFASFAAFFPEGRNEIQRIEYAFLKKHLPELPSATPLVFSDQYISSGGQLFELLSGRDRFVADLRPLVFERYGPNGALTCHPYDLACLPVARASTCIIEDPWGRPLSAPLDTLTPIAWVGYANKALADRLRPTLQETLKEFGYAPNP